MRLSKNRLFTKANWRFSALAAAAAAVGVLLVYALCGIWPFGDKTVLTGDLSGIYLPLQAWLSRGDFSFYSFSKSLGGGMQGLFAYIPLRLYTLLFSAVGLERYAALYGVLGVLKLGFAAGAFSLFVGRKTAASPASAMLGFCYALMSYSFIYAQNIMWVDNLAWLPVVLLCLDVLIERGRLLPFALAYFICILNNYYTAYMIALFCALYFVWQAAGQSELTKKAFGNRLLRFLGGGALGAGLSAALLVPLAAQTFANKGLSAGAAGGLFAFSPREFFRQAVYLGFTWDQVETGPPIVYGGMLCLCGLAVFFVAGGISKRLKLLSGGVLLVFMASFLIAPLNRVWHLFRDPIWFPFRYSFLFVGFCLLLAGLGLAQGIGKKRQTLFYCLLLAAVSGATLASQLGVLSLKKLALSAALLTGFGLLVYFAFRADKTRLKKLATLGLMAAVFVEMAVNGGYITSQFELRGDAATSAGITEIQALLALTEQDEFARVEKDYYSSLNDPLYYGYNGLNHFSSLQDNASTELLVALGYSGLYNNPTFAPGAANALLGVQYAITNGRYAATPRGELVGAVGDKSVYRLESAPFAFEAQSIDWAGAGGQNPFEALNAIYSQILGEPVELYTKIPIASNGGGAYAATHAQTRDGYFYLYYKSGVGSSSVSWNGAALGDVGFENQYGVAPLGALPESGGLSFTVSNGEDVALYRENSDVLARCLAALWAGAPNDIEVTDGYIRFASGGAARTVVLSLPYDAGWQLYINGERQPLTAAYGSLCALTLAAGEHVIELRYRPPGLIAGIAVSAASLAAAAAIFFIGRRRATAGQREAAL